MTGAALREGRSAEKAGEAMTAARAAREAILRMGVISDAPVGQRRFYKRKRRAKGCIFATLRENSRGEIMAADELLSTGAHERSGLVGGRSGEMRADPEFRE